MTDPLRTNRVVVIGAGVGGLVAALLLTAKGVEVTVVERAEGPGGKMRQVAVAGRQVDAGPTVFTMRRIFEEIFAEAGASLGEHLDLRPVEILARHAWTDGSRLDLHADIERSADAIAAFAGPREALGFLRFCAQARRMFETLDASFMRSSRPSIPGLIRGAGFFGVGDLRHIKPFSTLWQALDGYFRDPRLRQLFGRYATYLGASPFDAPATLMLVAHVEQQGVWLVDGGMHNLACTLARLAEGAGAVFRYGTEARQILVTDDRVAGVKLATGEALPADAVVFNGDTAALADGRLGRDVVRATGVGGRPARSLSAMTWALVAETEGFPLAHHNVFFSDNYAAEFEDIFGRSRLPRAPTVYICAQDRDDAGVEQKARAERLLCLVNAPAIGDRHAFSPSEIERCESTLFAQLERCGLHVRRRKAQMTVTTPTDFAQHYPGTGGALYGPVSHGWRASFQRPGARSRIPGLYLAGGSAHPGPGVPMAALSGKMAAASLIADFASTIGSRRAVTSGGISTRSATTAGMG